jgi:hypothetical protein
MLLLLLIMHLLNDLSKHAHVVEYEGEGESGTLALGHGNAAGGGGGGGVCVCVCVCVCEFHNDTNEWEREQSAKGTRVGRRPAPLSGISTTSCMDSLLDALTSVPPGE